ncbi:hypothetical protein QMT40_002492 [Parvibaculaceae bacterium PLY_AMNH_Bact1]|nr:hypothetical protein QMT40_002492 [Parvibaculaceae bacterium PLY_AMNH_Bact1]
MQHKPDVATRSLLGGPPEIVPVPSIAETKGLVTDGAHMRMDPRILTRISDVVSILEQDYTKVLLSHISDMEGAYIDWKSGTQDSRAKIYEIAHDIRGIAGTFGRSLSGQIASRICARFDQTADAIPSIEDHIEALNHVANLSPEPEGTFAQLVLKRLDELAGAPPTPADIAAADEKAEG